MKNFIKTAIVLVIIGVGVFWALNFIFLNKQGPRSKATGETIDIIYDPTAATVAANADFPVTVKIKPSVDVTLRGYYLRVPFDKTKLKVKSIEYKIGVASADLGNTNSDLTAVNQNGVLELSGEVQNNIGQVIEVSATGTELVKLTFTALSAAGTSFQSGAKFYLLGSDGIISEAGLTAVPKFDVNGGGALPGAVSCVSFSDDFSSATLNTGNWRLWTNGNGTALNSNGLLNINLPESSDGAKLVNIEAITKPLHGDFTAEITLTSRNESSTYEFFQFNNGLEGFSGSQGFNGFGFRLLSGSINTEVYGTNNPTNPGPQNHNVSIPKSTPVKLKLERTGTTVKMYYDLMTGQGYQLLRTFENFNTDQGRAVLGLQHTGAANLRLDGVFDNYSQNCLTSNVNPTQPASGSGTVTGNVKLNLKLKFQGINKKPVDSLNSMTVSVKQKKPGDTTLIESKGTFTADDKGVWSGAVGFDMNPVPTGGIFTVYVKGAQHIQKKICDNAPSEATPGTYRCGDGKITFAAGDNNLDLTKVTLLVGDLDQNGLVDSIDLGLIKNNLGKKDEETLKKADLNRDGVVDTQDFSLILAALAARTDEL